MICYAVLCYAVLYSTVLDDVTFCFIWHDSHQNGVSDVVITVVISMIRKRKREMCGFDVKDMFQYNVCVIFSFFYKSLSTLLYIITYAYYLSYYYSFHPALTFYAPHQTKHNLTENHERRSVYLCIPPSLWVARDRVRHGRACRVTDLVDVGGGRWIQTSSRRE